MTVDMLSRGEANEHEWEGVLYLPVAWFLLRFGPKMYKKTLGY